MPKRNPADEIPAYLKALNTYSKKVNLIFQTPEKQAQLVYAFTKMYFDSDPGLGVFRVDSPGVDPTIFKGSWIKAIKQYGAALPFDVGLEVGYDPQTGGVTLSVEGTYKKQGAKSVVTLGGTKLIDLNTFGLAGIEGQLGNLLKLGLKVYSSPFDETISIEYSFGGLGLTKTSAVIVGRDDQLVTSTLSGWIRDSINNNGNLQDSNKYQEEITNRMLVNLRNAERTGTNYDLAADLAAQIFLKTQARQTENIITLYWAEGKPTEYNVQRTRDRTTGAATLKVSYIDKSITTVNGMVGQFTTEAFYQYDQKTGAMLGRSYRYTRKSDSALFIDLAGNGDVKLATADLIQAFRRRTDSFCFLAGTDVLMADGSVKPIEDIRVGDQVQSFDEAGALEASTVLEVYPGEAREWLRLPNGVQVTFGHSFLTEHGDFQPVGEMVRLGVKAVRADGAAVDIAGAETVSSETAVPIYNFEVARTHTYIAGGLRVHNTSRPPSLSDDAGIWSAPKFISGGVYEYTTTDENGTWTYRTHDADGDGVVDYTTYEVERAGGWKERGRLGKSEDGVVATVLQEIPPVRFADFAQALGSALGSYLGNGNVATSVAASTILGTVGQNIGQLIDLNHGVDLGFQANGEIKKAFGDFNHDLGQAFQGAVAGQIGSYLSLELGKALGLSGFGAELFQSVGGTITSTIISNAMGGRALFDGLRAAEAFGTSTSAAAAGGYSAGVLGSAIGSFLGSKLGSMVVPVHTQAGAALSSLGSTLGTIAFSSGTSAGIVSAFAAAIHAQLAASFGRIAASILVPGIGAFIGFVIGALIGNLFGRKKPKTPTASAETMLQLPYARYELGSVVTANGGNRALVTSMATLARDTLNGVIDIVAYTDDTAYVSNLSGYTTTQVYGHAGNQIYVKVNGVQKNFGSSDEAVGYGTAIAIKNTKIVGGDIFAKRAITNSQATDITALGSDINLAAEYRRYLESRYEINALIAASPTTEFAAGWLIELNSISELGLGKFAPSDFYGGLQGFLGSFDLAGHGTAFENVKISAQGAAVEIQARGQTSDGVFSILPQAIDGASDNDILNSRFQQGLAGWDLATYQVTGPARGVNLSADWSGHGNDVFWMFMPGTPVAGSIMDSRSDWMTAQAGVAYETTVEAAQHRGYVQLLVEFYDANRQLLQTVVMPGTAREGGGGYGDLANFNLIGGTAVAPTGTAFRRVNLRMVATGGVTPYGFYTQPTSRVVPNDVFNTHFQQALAGWDMAAYLVASPQRGVNLSADWSGSGNDVFWMEMPGTPAAGAIIDQRSAWMTAQAGVAYQSTVYAAQHRGLAQMFVEFYDASRTLISAVVMAGSGRDYGGAHGDLATFNLIGGTATAPVGAVYRRVVLRLVSTGGETPYGFFTLPTSREVVDPAVGWATKGEAVRIEDMSLVGYTARVPGATTSGNDLVDQHLAVAGVTIDDNHTEQQWVPDNYHTGQEGHYEPRTVSGGDDIFVGGAGNDTLYGRTGWDWLDGGAGNDTLDGGDQNDVLLGGAGADNLYGGAGDDYLAGGDGVDYAYGGAGADTLVDGLGSEILQGEDGDDTFVVTADYTFNWMWGGGQDPASDPSGKDTLSAERMAVGVAMDIDYRPADWNASADPLLADSRSKLVGVTDAVTGQWFTNAGLLNVENATGSAFNDRLYGTAGDNVLKGLAGNDQIWGRDGNDVLEGGAGADMMDGAGDVDILSYAGSSAGVYVDLSTGEAFGGDAEGDFFSGFEGVRGSQLADQLKGNAGDNRLEGLAGDDWLVATVGADIYDGGEGKDFVDYSEAVAGVTLYLGGYTATGVTNGYGYGAPYNTPATGQVYIAVEGVVGSAFADSLGAGDGDQTFVGGGGNDWLAGGAGTDTYVLNIGDGADTIVEDTGGWNVLSLGEGIKVSDLIFGTAGGAGGWLSLTVRGGNASAYAGGNFADPSNARVKTIDFNGGGQLDIGSIDYGVGGVTDGADTLVGLSGEHYDLIVGLNGADTIWGRASGLLESKGNVIIGGLGDDVINTSNGDDQFAYDRGDGFDTITDTGGEDTLVFGSTVAAEDVIYQVVGSDLYIGAKNPTNAALTASQVTDRVKIVGGGVKWVEIDSNYEATGFSYLTTVEYVIAGGTSIDLRKLDIAWTVQTYQNYSNYYPIALDLDGDGLDLSTVEGSNVVVKTAQGGLSKLAWVGPTDGFLAVDRDGDGAINKLSEISFVQDKPGATSDLEGLRTWDTNGDGVLDAKDANFSKILLFVDANQNGRSTAKELRTLEQAGIKAINLGGTATGYTAGLTTESFVQNTISFVWADGRTGEGYDVALARRVLGSEGLYAGEYQAEWGARDEDGTLGRLANDPKTAAKAARIKAKKGLLDKLGASYAEVKAAAQLDFSDTDKIDAQIAQRWKKMDASQKAAWLSGQASGMDGQQNLAALKAISSGQALSNALAKGAQAGQDLVANGLTQAGALVSAGDPGDLDGGGQAMSNGLGVTFDTAASLGGLAASQPLDAALSASAAIGQGQAWWRGEPDGGLSGAGSLAALLATMDQGVGQPAPGSLAVGDDPALLQQQMLLRQAMAGFGGQAGGSAAVWNRDTAQTSAMLAASTAFSRPAAGRLELAV